MKWLFVEMAQQAKHDFKKNINKKKRASSYKRASSFWLFVRNMMITYSYFKKYTYIMV